MKQYIELFSIAYKNNVRIKKKKKKAKSNPAVLGGKWG